jgi:hypothetical protein
VSISLAHLTRQRALKPDQPVVNVHVLLWEAPPSESSHESDWSPTEVGAKTRPTATDPVVFKVEKVPGRANPFAMGVTVGRVETNDIIVDDGSVSRFHAWLQFDTRQKIWWLCDAESKNGTFLGAQRLKPNAKVQLADSARLRFGDVSMTFLSPGALLKLIETRSSSHGSNR